MTPAGRIPTFVEPEKLATSSVVTNVFDQLLAAVHRGELQPGQRINDEQLAREYGVSRTPVREALQRLREIGIIEAAASRFTRIAVVTPAQTAQAFLVWLALYGALVDEVIPIVPDEVVEAMERDAAAFAANIQPWDADKLATTNFDFYSRLVQLSTNAALLRAITSVVHILRLGSLHLPAHLDVATLSVAQRAMLSAARNRDVAEAHAALEQLRAIEVPQS